MAHTQYRVYFSGSVYVSAESDAEAMEKILHGDDVGDSEYGIYHIEEVGV